MCRIIPGAVLEEHVGAVPAYGGVDLRTETARLGQAPLAARGPRAVVRHGRVDGLAHDGLRFEARLESPAGGWVCGYSTGD